MSEARGRHPVVDWWVGALAVARRELLSLFVTPLAYVVATLFLLEQGWNFSLLLRVLNDPLAAPGPVMQFYFGGSFFIFWLPVIFICSAISMRLIAEERRQGTLEALLTAPLQPSQIVLGKFAGAYLFYGALWLPTGSFYILLRAAAGPGSGPELGPILAGYFGTALVGASFLAVGLLASALSRSQLSAAITTFVACTIALMAGLLVEQVESESMAAALEWTSLLSMMQELAQGIVDGHWIWLHGGVVGAALALAVLAVDPRRDLQSLVQGLGMVVFFAGLAVLGGRHGERADWTRGQVYTLSDRARDVLEELAAPVEVTVLVPAHIGGGRTNPLRAELREVLARMAAVNGALRVRILDPDRDRQESERLLDDFGLSGRELAEGVVLLRSGKGAQMRRAHILPRELVTWATGPEVQANGPRVKAFRGEEALLSKILAVTDPTQLRVCYSQGHGEPEFDDLEPYGGYAHLRDLLRDAAIEVEKVVPLDRREGLDACDVLLIAGPAGPLEPGEVAAVRTYLEGGGDMLLLSGAVILRGKSGLAPHGLEPLLASRGIRMGQRVVLDPHGVPGASELIAFGVDHGWADHPATRSLIGRSASFVQVREMLVGEGAEILASSSEQAWAEADLDAFRRGVLPEPDERDRLGALPVVAASEVEGSRVVVVASDQFALNAFLREDVAYDHGRDLILNSIGWLSERDALLGIRAREREHVKLLLSPDQLQRMSWMCVAGMPAFAIGLGFLVLWRRRR